MAMVTTGLGAVTIAAEAAAAATADTDEIEELEVVTVVDNDGLGKS